MCMYLYTRVVLVLYVHVHAYACLSLFRRDYSNRVVVLFKICGGHYCRILQRSEKFDPRVNRDRTGATQQQGRVGSRQSTLQAHSPLGKYRPYSSVSITMPYLRSLVAAVFVAPVACGVANLDLGDYKMPVTTSSEEAREAFNSGE